MVLLDLLITGVGVGVAKGMLKLWFEEDPITQGIGNSVAAFLSSKTTNALHRRRAEAQLNKVSKKVAESIQDTIETRFPQLAEEAKKRVAHAAGETVNATRLTTDLLVYVNLSPELLLDVFLGKTGGEGGNPFYVDTGANPAPKIERDLYRAILFECSQLIIDGASMYPKFNDAVFSELLSGQDEIVKRMVTVLDELDHIREESKSPFSAEYDEFAEQYRRAVVRRLDEIQLFGVDLSATTKRYKLSTAYVSLMVENSYSEDDGGANALSIEDALRASKRLFIRGGAGSGKTTLLQWVAVSAAAGREEIDSTWGACIPFFIRLRNFANDKLPTPEQFPGLISETLPEPPSGWVRSKLRDGAAIILIDGLDELAQDRKDAVREWLKDLLAEYGNSNYILTSRPNNSEFGILESADFLEADLREMSAADIEAFVSHWHAAVGESLRSSEELSAMDELEVELLRKIKSNIGIYKLVTSPLLCAVVCALHRDRIQNIPEDRVDLYEACIDMFLRRDQERRIELPQYPNLSPRQIKTLLSDLAYWYLRNGVAVESADKVDVRIQKKLDTFKGLAPSVVSLSVREGLVARSGILREPASGMVDFPHKTFQEFFAASEIVEQRDFGVLLQHSRDQESWSETIVLAVGKANQEEAEGVIVKLVHEAESTKDPRLLLLAVDCMGVCVSIDPKICQLVEKQLAKVVPPKKLSDAVAISKAGDLIVPYLKNVRAMRVREASYTVAALALIGTGAAWDEIRRVIATDDRWTIRGAVIVAATRTQDPVAYIEEFVPRFSFIRIYSQSWEAHMQCDAWGNLDTKLTPELVRYMVGMRWVDSILFDYVEHEEASTVQDVAGYEPTLDHDIEIVGSAFLRPLWKVVRAT